MSSNGPLRPSGPDARSERRSGRQACAFYATDDAYALGVLVAVEQLRRLGLRPSTEIVLLHHGVSAALLRDLESRGVRLLAQSTLPFVHGYTYRDCLIKLRVLGLVEYDTIVFLDADGLPLRSIDELLDRPIKRPLAAIRAHWVQPPIFSTMLLVVKPAARLWDQVEAAFPEARVRGEYDMDLLNRVLGAEIEALPEGTACLDSEFDRHHGPFHFGDPEETLARTSYVHFSSLAKPWYYRPARVRRLRADAHPVFHQLWATWWALRDDVRPERMRDRIRRRILYDLGVHRLQHAVGRTILALKRRIPVAGCLQCTARQP